LPSKNADCDVLHLVLFRWPGLTVTLQLGIHTMWYLLTFI